MSEKDLPSGWRWSNDTDMLGVAVKSESLEIYVTPSAERVRVSDASLSATVSGRTARQALEAPCNFAVGRDGAVILSKDGALTTVIDRRDGSAVTTPTAALRAAVARALFDD